MYSDHHKNENVSTVFTVTKCSAVTATKGRRLHVLIEKNRHTYTKYGRSKIFVRAEGDAVYPRSAACAGGAGGAGAPHGGTLTFWELNLEVG